VYKFAFSAVLLLALSACKTQPVKPTVIEKPQTCYGIIKKPELFEVSFEINQLINGEWAITIDDENFDKILFNHIRVDNYIKESYNILKQYDNDCSK